MAAEDDAIRALTALHNHRQVIVDAHLNNRGAINDVEENNAAINALKKHRFAWFHPEDDSAQLNGALSQLLDQTLRNFRRQMASEVIASTLDNLQNHLVIEYIEAKKRCLQRDQERLKSDITECIYDLIERLSQSVTMFSQYLSSGFTYVTDLDLRLRENQRVIKMGEKLNDVLSEFDIEELDILAGSDAELRRLMSSLLPRYIERVQAELVNTLHQLAELLNSTREGAERSRLIGAFEHAFGNDKGFSPNIDGLVKFPPVLNWVSLNPIVPWVNTLDASAEVALSDLCQGLRVISLPVIEASQIVLKIEDATELPSLEMLPDPIVNAADDLVQCILQEGIKVTASKALLALEIDCPMSLWMGAVMNHIHSLRSETRERIAVTYIEEHHPLYPDNYYVYDLLIGLH